MSRRWKHTSANTLAIVALAGLSFACLLWTHPAPERSVMITDLLIGLDDMPEGWNLRSGPEESTLEYNVDEGLEIVFEADSPHARTVAVHVVLRYEDLDLAARIYDEYVTPSDFGKASIPDGWVYRSVMVDPYHVFCYQKTLEPQNFCRWSGLYAEYIVIFHTWLIPERMTLEDFESIVTVIDRRTACSLGGPCLDSSRRSR